MLRPQDRPHGGRQTHQEQEKVGYPPALLGCDLGRPLLTCSLKKKKKKN